jgi:hypothetical protein
LDDQFNFKLSVIVDAQTVRRKLQKNKKHIAFLFFVDYRMFQSIGYATSC